MRETTKKLFSKLQEAEKRHQSDRAAYEVSSGCWLPGGLVLSRFITVVVWGSRVQCQFWCMSVFPLPLPPPPHQTSISHYRREAEQSSSALARVELELQERDVKVEDLQRLLTGMEKVSPPPIVRLGSYRRFV